MIGHLVRPGRRFTLPTEHGDVVFENPSLSAHFVDKGEHVAAMELSGKLDLRSVARLGGGDDRDAICRTWGDAGQCEPCRDGKAQCLQVTVSGLRARGVSGKLR